MAGLDPISIVSHKLRTPLTVIISTVNNLLDGAFGPLKEEQKKWLKKLDMHTNNLESLVNELLSFLKEGSVQSREAARAFGADVKTAHPSFAPPKKSSSSGSDTHGSSTPSQVLIVDDEPDILDVIKEGLEMQGLTSICASNGEEALRLAREKRPDLILMDVLLQNQNGLEICRRIKSELRSFTPVILMTGQQDLREKISGSTGGADEILIKPFQ